MMEWQPIETAPKDIIVKFDRNGYGQHILAFYQGSPVFRCRWWQSDSGRGNFLADGATGVGYRE